MYFTVSAGTKRKSEMLISGALSSMRGYFFCLYSRGGDSKVNISV